MMTNNIYIPIIKISNDITPYGLRRNGVVWKGTALESPFSYALHEY